MESVSTNKPLYCFKMDSETHEIVKYIIDDYKLNEKVSKSYSDYLKWNKVCNLLDERYPLAKQQ